MADASKANSGNRGKAATIIGLALAVLLVLGCALVVGSLMLVATAGIDSAGLRLGLAGGAALLAALVVPLALDRKVTKAYRKLDATAASTRKQILSIWNALLLAIAVLALPGTTRGALTQHGHWFVSGTADGPTSALGRVIGRAATYIPRSAPAEQSPTLPAASASSASPSTAAGSSAATPGASATASSVADAEPLPVPDHDLTPQEVFRLRADTVVVIATRQTLSKEDPFYSLYEELGVQTINGLGSGFIVESQGLVVTNHHVVDGAESMQVALRSGAKYPTVEVLATDREHDLALLSIQAKDLRLAPLCPDEALSAGARAIAIGSPLGLEYSVTDGIVSAVRDIQGTTFLQMQTTIAPGSSGGPLFGVRGRVMGVNTATHGAGLNLAVHVKYLRDLLKQERKPQKLAEYVPGARIAKLSVEGAEASSVELMQFDQALELLSVGVDSCVKTAPADPYLTLTYDKPSGGIPVAKPGAIDSNLGDEARACLKTNLGLTGGMMGLIMSKAFSTQLRDGESVVLVVEIAGIRAAETPDAAPRETSLTVRFELGKPGGGRVDGGTTE